MSESKHTPGPWAVANSGERVIVGGLRHPATIANCHHANRNIIANYHHANRNIEECEANARLIAAAPDLLEACKKLAVWATNECMPVGGPQDGPWDMLDAAIAKAKQ